MRPSNPACYECPKGKNGLHHWRKSVDGKMAMCIRCGLELNEADTADCYHDTEPH